MTQPWKRTHTSGELRKGDVGKTVTLAGWVESYRDHGGVIFIDLRDRYGKTQVVFNPAPDPELHSAADRLRNEYVVSVTGEVRPRPDGMANPKLATGEIEVVARSMVLHNASENPPFEIRDETDAGEDIRLRRRYLDLRRPIMRRAIEMRHRVAKTIRDYYDELGFLEIETPFLTKSTPEGARDFLVPSRLEPGAFYALPQSPQLFKQLFMVAGLDRYFQIVKCFRDEDLRANRQPEFTQLDVEMSFVDESDVMAVTEGLFKRLFKEVLGRDLELPLPRLTYSETMSRYGSDAPDTRYGLELVDLTEWASTCEFKVFRGAVESGGAVRAVRLPGGADLTRREIDELTTFATGMGAKGLAWMKVEGGKFTGAVAKFFDEAKLADLRRLTGAEDGDILFFVADVTDLVVSVLAALRAELAERRDLIPGDRWDLLWVTDFPLFTLDPETGRLDPAHHPFTSPAPADVPLLDTEPLKARARAYDLVLNGQELGGGSIRIHKRDLQEKMFELLKIAPDEARLKFGFLLDGLAYGAPPHGGIAFGLDRILMLFMGFDSIRDVIPFPKTQRGTCPLTGAPAPVDDAQLAELGIKRDGPQA